MCAKGCGTPGTLCHRHVWRKGPADLERGNWLNDGNRAAASADQVSKCWETAVLPDPTAALPPVTIEDAQRMWSGAEISDRKLQGDVYTDGSTFHPRSRRMARAGCGLPRLTVTATL